MGAADYIDKGDSTNKPTDPNKGMKTMLNFIRRGAYLGGFLTMAWSTFSFVFFIYVAKRTNCYHSHQYKCGISILAILVNIPMAWLSTYLIRTLKRNTGDSQQDEYWITEAASSKIVRYWGCFGVMYMFVQTPVVVLWEHQYPYDFMIFVLVWLLPTSFAQVYHFSLQNFVQSLTPKPQI